MRNPFRKRGRLILSLFTLTMAGAIFMAVVNLQASLNDSLNEMLGFWRYDAWLLLDGYYPNEKLTNKAKAIPGVVETEAWDVSLGRYVRQDGSESANLYLLAPPSGSELLQPPIIEGRALHPQDTNAIVVPPALLQKEAGVHLGDEITLKIEGRESQFTIVGVMQMVGNDAVGYMTYMSYEDFARHVREPNRANALIFTIGPSDLKSRTPRAGRHTSVTISSSANDRTEPYRRNLEG